MLSAMNDIVFKSAKRLASLIRTRKLSAVEVMNAHIAQVERSLARSRDCRSRTRT